MNNQYNEPGAETIFFVWANQTRANILLNPQPCRGFIANDTKTLIGFDKDLNPFELGESHIAGTSGYIAQFTDTDTIGNSGIYTSGGLVGIGTTVLTYKLEVAGDVNIPTGSHYKINGANLAYGDVGAFPATHGVSSGYLARATSTTVFGNSLIYDNATNVGIGTSSPSKSLEIVTSGNVTQQLTRNIVSDGNYFSQLSLYQQGLSSYNSFEIDSYNPGATGNFLSSPIANSKLNMIYGKGDDLAIVNHFAKPIWMVVDANSSPKYFVMDSAGNIGIGTTVPGNLLDIEKSASTSSAAVKIGVSGGDTALYIDNASSYSIYTNRGNAIFGATSGSVGIGTTNPTYPLTVVGIGVTSWEDVAYFGLADDGLLIQPDSGVVNLIGIDKAKSVYNAVHIKAGATDGLVINTSNNISIKTTDSPAGSNLTLKGNMFIGPGVTATDYPLVLSAATGTSHLNAYDNNLDISTVTSGYLALGAVGSEIMRLTGGKVGIGTTVLTYKLEVAGDVNIPTGSHYKINGTNLAYGDVGAFPATHGVSSGYLARATSTTAFGNSLLQDNAAGVGLNCTPGTDAFCIPVHWYLAAGHDYGTPGAVGNATIELYDGSDGYMYVNPYSGIKINKAGANLTEATIGHATSNEASTSSLGFGAGYGSGVGAWGSWIYSCPSAGVGKLIFNNRDSGYYDVLTISGRNVGIGTTNPDYSLEVYAPSGSESAIQIASGYSTGVAWRWYIPASSEDLYLANTAISFNAMTIVGNGANMGNVGIGSTSPGNKLDVTGAVCVSGALGINGASPQTPYASGGAVATGAGSFGFASDAERVAITALLANVRIALVNVGIMS